MRAEADITVDRALTVVDAHAISDHAQHRLIHQVPRLDAGTRTRQPQSCARR